jgi:putative tributyrin esterase
VSKFRTIEVSDPRFEHDGLREVTFKSPALGGRADVTLFVPPAAAAATASASRDVPVVVLLHGVYGSHWAWAKKGAAHRTAARLIERGTIPPVVLAMPSDGLWGDGSGYVRHAGGNDGDAGAGATPRDFERYVVDDVPACVAEVVPSVTAGSPLFIAGLSMGGFGALRLGAKHPRRFRGVSGHSSITHFSQMSRFVEEPLAAYGPPPEAEQSVLHWMTTNRATLPPVRFDCGTEDPLIEDNRRLHRELDVLGIPHVYEEFPGGHEWPYWERHLEDSLRFFAGLLPPAPPA